MRDKFWEHYSLGELNAKEWEALCDGCAQCCLIRDVDNNQVTVFNVTCELLDTEQSRCSDYKNRLSLMPDCHKLKANNVGKYDWLPKTCAYRRIHKGKSLPTWHPLLTGSRQRMQKKGITVCPSALPESQVPRRKMQQNIIQTWSI